jgi:hypothetical protein
MWKGVMEMASRNGRLPRVEATVRANGTDAEKEIAVETRLVAAVQQASRAKAEASEKLNGGSGSDSTLDKNGLMESGDEEGVSSDALAAVQRLTGQVGPSRREWPVEAERASDRRKFKQSVAVELLASGKAITVVARDLHVDRGTIYRWLQDPVFLGELEARRGEIIEGLLDHQLLGARMAVVKLMELMESSNEQVSLRAVVALQSAGLHAYQLIDVRKRIERIEDNLGMFFSWRK